jgi:hypothetical protein
MLQCNLSRFIPMSPGNSSATRKTARQHSKGINMGTSPSPQEEKQNTLDKRMVIAAYNRDVETVKNLIDQGANPYACNSGVSPLCGASEEGHTEIVQTLLEAGVNPNVADGRGYYPLDRAASNGHVDTVKVLIKGRADINDWGVNIVMVIIVLRS